MAGTKRMSGEEADDPHRQPPRRLGKGPVEEGQKKKKQKRRSADEELTQEQAYLIIEAHEAGRAGRPVQIAEPEPAGTHHQPSRRVTRSTPSETTETPVALRGSGGRVLSSPKVACRSLGSLLTADAKKVKKLRMVP